MRQAILLFCRRVACAATVLPLASAVSAQAVRVRLVDELSRQPVAGALVSTLDTLGNSGPAVLSSAEGIAVVRVSVPGTYRLYVRRIGYAPFSSEPTGIDAETGQLLELVVPSRRVQLNTVVVTARRTCDGQAQSPSAEAEPVWEEVKKALESSAITRELRMVVTEGLSFERRLALDGKLLSADTTSLGFGGARPFSAQLPEVLERDGWVLGTYSAGYTFYAPDERVLLSGGFTRRHCISIAGAPRREGDRTLVGLAFEPRTNNQLSEIRGTIWVDSASSELRSVEFTYVRATLPVEARDIGGRVAFERARSGAWIVSDWHIRIPFWRAMTVGRVGTSIRLAGYTEVGGRARVVREVTALAASVRRVVSGTVFDSVSGRPVVGAQVRIPALGRDTVTDFLGRFRFEDLGVGVFGLAAEHPTWDFDAPLGATANADVTTVASADITLAFPSFDTVWRRLCGAGALSGAERGAVVFGRVRWALTGTPGSAAKVEVGSGVVHADSSGRYVACLPEARTVALRVVREPVVMPSVLVRVDSGRVVRRDLSLAGDEAIALLLSDTSETVSRVAAAAGATVAGVLRDPTGRGVEGARVRVAGVAGETKTDGRGFFALTGIPAGRHVVRLEAIGFQRAARLVDVQPGDSAHIEARVERVTWLPAVTVRQPARRDVLRAEIAERALAGHGYTFDSLKLAQVRQLHEIFQSVPLVRVRTGARGFVVETPTMRTNMPSLGRVGVQAENWCVPLVYLDDVPSGFDQLSELPKDGIAQIEFYSRAANAPLRYTGTAPLGHSGTAVMTRAAQGRATEAVVKGTCGVVLVWTKVFLGAGVPRRP